MIIDFSAKLTERDALPKFDVNVSFHPRNNKKDQLSHFIEIAARGIVESETIAIKDDRLKFDRQAMEFFRGALVDHLVRVRRNDGGNLDGIDPNVLKSGRTSAFLHAEFGAALEKGLNEVTIIPHVERAPFPIPKMFHIFLPDPEQRNPPREDIFRALIPFEKTLREIWRHEDDDIVAVSIQHKPIAPLFAPH